MPWWGLRKTKKLVNTQSLIKKHYCNKITSFRVYEVYFLLNCGIWKLELKSFNMFVTACSPLNDLHLSLPSSKPQCKHITISCQHHTCNYHANVPHLSRWRLYQRPQTQRTPIATASLLCLKPISTSDQTTRASNDSLTQMFLIKLDPTKWRKFSCFIMIVTIQSGQMNTTKNSGNSINIYRQHFLQLTFIQMNRQAQTNAISFPAFSNMMLVLFDTSEKHSKRQSGRPCCK